MLDLSKIQESLTINQNHTVHILFVQDVIHNLQMSFCFSILYLIFYEISTFALLKHKIKNKILAKTHFTVRLFCVLKWIIRNEKQCCYRHQGLFILTMNFLFSLTG